VVTVDEYDDDDGDGGLRRLQWRWMVEGTWTWHSIVRHTRSVIASTGSLEMFCTPATETTASITQPWVLVPLRIKPRIHGGRSIC